MTPLDRFNRCVAFVCGPSIEGGYSNLPADRGGPTNHGITLATLSDWRGHPCFASDVQALTQTEATAIYRARYWAPIAGDKLPEGVDLITFDCAVNQGPGTAAMVLQGVVHVPEDGHVGPQTLGALALLDAVQVIDAIRDERAVRYRKSPDWPTFGAGWTNRLNNVCAQAISWA